ncbi:MAG: hypothetical protein OXB98_09310 [Bryobacterales bacterium]|nr:hypothetical protein [Bryobacterales bacterium]
MSRLRFYSRGSRNDANVTKIPAEGCNSGDNGHFGWPMAIMIDDTLTVSHTPDFPTGPAEVQALINVVGQGAA